MRGTIEIAENNGRNLVETQLPEESQEVSIPRSVVPYNRDDDRSRYLGLRSSGFTIREALGLIGKAKSTLSHWRKDTEFLRLEDMLPELRKTLALEYASLEFLRNYRLVLEKDYRVIKDSLVKRTRTDKEGDTVTVPMETQDYNYLLRMRAHYTPQQLQAIEQLFGGGGGGNGQPTNFTDFVLSLTRTSTVEEVKLESRKRQEPELARITEVESDAAESK